MIADVDVAGVFAALGDATRLSLVVRLIQGGQQPIARLTETTALTRQAITKHLHTLQTAGLVSARRIGRETRYGFEAEKLTQATAYLDFISRHWDDTIGRLRNFVESDDDALADAHPTQTGR